MNLFVFLLIFFIQNASVCLLSGHKEIRQTHPTLTSSVPKPESKLIVKFEEIANVTTLIKAALSAEDRSIIFGDAKYHLPEHISQTLLTNWIAEQISLMSENLFPLKKLLKHYRGCPKLIVGQLTQTLTDRQQWRWLGENMLSIGLITFRDLTMTDANLTILVLNMVNENISTEVYATEWDFAMQRLKLDLEKSFLQFCRNLVPENKFLPGKLHVKMENLAELARQVLRVDLGVPYEVLALFHLAPPIFNFGFNRRISRAKKALLSILPLRRYTRKDAEQEQIIRRVNRCESSNLQVNMISRLIAVCQSNDWKSGILCDHDFWSRISMIAIIQASPWIAKNNSTRDFLLLTKSIYRALPVKRALFIRQDLINCLLKHYPVMYYSCPGICEFFCMFASDELAAIFPEILFILIVEYMLDTDCE